MNKSNFKKKVYRKLETSPLTESISVTSMPASSQPKKIIPTTATEGEREKFNTTFLPLLIEVFELRQSIDNYKTQLQASPSLSTENESRSPQEVLARLEQLRKDIEESQRWCEGAILQITKGIEEAKEALGEKKEGFFKRLIRRMTK